MKVKKEKIEEMIAQLDAMIESANLIEEKYREALERVHPAFKKSARNLLHYRALRQHDIRGLQKKLGNLGLSRLGKAEAHVMASMQLSRAILYNYVSESSVKSVNTFLSIKKGNKLLNSHAKDLLGYRSKNRRVRIMVTQPSVAADDSELASKMLEAGMNTARINCAHDSPEEWKRMVDHIKAASKKADRKCRISMDLGGPKIRTGEIEPGPMVVHFSPKRNDLGEVVSPGIFCLVPEGQIPPPGIDFLPVDQVFYDQLEEGLSVSLRDTRGKKRSFKIMRLTEWGYMAHCYDSTYILAETALKLETAHGVVEGKAGNIDPVDQYLYLHTGDRLILHKDKVPGKPAVYDKDGQLLQVAEISCTSEEVFGLVKEGEKVLFDDGKIEGHIDKITSERMEIKILYAKSGGTKLKADKGINFPDSNLKISGLTEKDKEDLAFVAEHADVVNMSFVNHKSDVQEIIQELDRLQARDKLGIILKIETQSGFNNLTDILIEAMQVYPLGVMIARGDLAIECGWENMARIQEEILALCQAAHVPVVWATQVLENLAKKGMPSRAEITDASMAQRAECVMLNKGRHINDAIRMLGYILSTMMEYQDKKAPMLPALEMTGGRQARILTDVIEED